MKIGLLWHSFFSGNLGVSALATANATIIATEAQALGIDVEFLFFGPKGDRSFTVPEHLPRNRYVEVSSASPGNVSRIRKLIAECGLVFDIGGGDSFADIYGFKRLFKITALKFLVPNAARRLVLSPQTIGPFNSPITRRMGRAGMRHARLVFCRDAASLDRARSLIGADRADRLMLTTDVAFALTPFSGWPTEFPVLDAEERHIGLNVSGLLFRGGYTGKNEFGLKSDYPRLIRSLIEALGSDPKNRIWLIPHVYRFQSDGLESDRGVCEELSAAYPNTAVAPAFRNAVEAKTFIGKMDVVLAARMHAAIAAVSSGTACVPMSYSIKFGSLFQSIGYSHVVEMRELDHDAALAAILAKIEDYQQLQAEAKAAAAAAQGKLDSYRTTVRTLLQEASE
ncbi:MAG: hypothetical protein CMH85_15550 [Novosphingobium sp.]|nr:hypothetical protein [Novosphingobium sp.]